MRSTPKRTHSSPNERIMISTHSLKLIHIFTMKTSYNLKISSATLSKNRKGIMKLSHKLFQTAQISYTSWIFSGLETKARFQVSDPHAWVELSHLRTMLQKLLSTQLHLGKEQTSNSGLQITKTSQWPTHQRFLSYDLKTFKRIQLYNETCPKVKAQRRKRLMKMLSWASFNN